MSVEPPPPTTPFYVCEVDEGQNVVTGNLAGATDQAQAVQIMLHLASTRFLTRYLAVIEDATSAIVAFVRS